MGFTIFCSPTRQGSATMFSCINRSPPPSSAPGLAVGASEATMKATARHPLRTAPAGLRHGRPISSSGLPCPLPGRATLPNNARRAPVVIRATVALEEGTKAKTPLVRIGTRPRYAFKRSPFVLVGCLTSGCSWVFLCLAEILGDDCCSFSLLLVLCWSLILSVFVVYVA